jgi:hypothetical protein
MSQSTSTDARSSSLSDRRNSLRGPVQTKARLTIVDGSGAGVSHDILTREQSLSGVSFLLRESLQVGQECQIEFEANGHPARKYIAEIVRSRPISNGRFEMALQFRKQL